MENLKRFTEEEAQLIAERLESRLFSRRINFDEVMIFEETDPKYQVNQTVFDDGNIHVTRGNWRWCVGVGEDVNFGSARCRRLEKIITDELNGIISSR